MPHPGSHEVPRLAPRHESRRVEGATQPHSLGSVVDCFALPLASFNSPPKNQQKAER